MNVPTNADLENQASGSPLGPGLQLRSARERQGLEASDVASQLHLQASIIESLEADDYEKLPSPVFIQGYLRNYARLLGLSEDAVVASYQRLLPDSDEQTTLPRQDEKQTKPMNSSHGVMKLVTWGIVLLLSALLFFWWLNRVELEEPEPFPTTEMMQEEEQTEYQIQSDNSPVFEAQEIAPVTPEIEPVDEITPTSNFEEPALLDQTSDSEEPAQSDIQQLEEAETQADSALQQEIAAPLVESPPVTSTESVTETVTPTGKKTLLFAYSGSCWTEVRDQDGKARIIGEMKSGAQRRLSSQYGPFTVVLGDASSVSLSIDGEPFDLKPFTRGKVAKFTLDPEKL
ncbi:MAG: RodZ domain-containing protein [Candidatus Thiodiazotropha sp. DIVDIV]